MSKTVSKSKPSPKPPHSMRRSEIRSATENLKQRASSPSCSRSDAARAEALLDALCAEYRAAGSPVVVSAPVPAWEIGRPAAWLYVSKRLELLSLPNEPLWASAVVTIGTTTCYRVSPAVAHWLDCAGRALEQRFIDGTAGRDQIDAYLEAMTTVWEFVAANIDSEAVCAAKDQPPVLPEG